MAWQKQVAEPLHSAHHTHLAPPHHPSGVGVVHELVDQGGRGGEVPQGVGGGAVEVHFAGGLADAWREGLSYQTWQGRVEHMQPIDRGTDRQMGKQDKGSVTPNLA